MSLGDLVTSAEESDLTDSDSRAENVRRILAKAERIIDHDQQEAVRKGDIVRGITIANNWAIVQEHFKRRGRK